MPDVKYTESSWEKTNQALSHLTGCYGIGVTEELKAVSRNLEEAEEVIRSYDEDRLIHFSHENHTSKYETLGEKLAVLQEFTTQVNGVLAEEIDDPFYKKIDAYIEAVRDLDISEYTTKNRLGITSKETIYGDGVGQTIEIEKTNVDLADIVNGKNSVGKLMNRKWKSYLKNHPGGDKISYSEYQTAILHSGAFEYKSVKDGQQSKEMFFTVGAVTATVVVGIFCPPAGMALGVTLAGSEVISAANGKDLISGRELGTGERWTRGVLGVVGLGLGAAELRAFSKSVSMVKGTKPGTLENLTQMMKHSSRSSYKELQRTVRNMSAVEKTGRAKELLNPNLLDELSKSGVKYNLDDVVMVGKDSSGKLLWLEKGNDKAGLKHIINGHVEDFSAKGIEDIPNFLHDTLKINPVKQGTGPKGPFSVYIIDGQKYTLAYGNNGFVVSFYPSK